MTLGSSFPEDEECGMEIVEVEVEVEVEGFGVEFERERESADIMERGRGSLLAKWNGSGG